MPDAPSVYRTGEAAYEGAYPGAPGANPRGFLGQLTETVGTMAMFYAPFLPVLAPALAATPVVGGAIKVGGAIRPIIEAVTAATTTGRGATSTGAEATSSGPSPQEQAILDGLQRVSSQIQQQQLGIYYQTAGPSLGLLRSATLESPPSPPPPRVSRRATRRSWGRSAAQQKRFLAAVLQQLQ